MAQLEFSNIPITALSQNTKHTLSLLLSPTKVLQSEDGLPRDWRGLASLCEIPGEFSPAISGSNSRLDPTIHVLELWLKKDIKEANLERLLEYLERIDRFDIQDDVSPLIEKDALMYIEKTKRSESSVSNALQVKTRYPPECQVLTRDDVYLSESGSGCMQSYNGLLLFADEDMDFALYVIREMEKCGLKLCVKDRDLLAGVAEHSTVMRLLAERCARLVVILSPEFLASPENGFFINFAQALGIDGGKRKIVPVLYKTCSVPALRYYHMLDYQRSLKFTLYNFWEKLRLSIQETSLEHSEDVTAREFGNMLPPPMKILPLPAPPITITTCPDSNGNVGSFSHADEQMSTSLMMMNAVDSEVLDNLDVGSNSLPSSSPLGSFKRTSKLKKLGKIIKNKLSVSTDNLNACNEIKMKKDNSVKKKWFKASLATAK